MSKASKGNPHLSGAPCLLNCVCWCEGKHVASCTNVRKAIDTGHFVLLGRSKPCDCKWHPGRAASLPFRSIHLAFLLCLDLGAGFHAGLEAGEVACIIIGVLAFVLSLSFGFWLWARKQVSEGPVQKHSEPQPSHLESGHPANHCEAASPDSMMLTYSPGLPAALVSGSASPRSVSSANLRTVGFGQMTTSNTLPKRDTTLGSLTSIEPSTGSLALFDPIQVLTKQLDAMHKQGILLRGRYRILGSSEQRSGSQGVVRFASLAVNSSKQLAVKFFLERHHFEVEQALYGNPALHDFLPPTDDVSLNDSEPHVLGRTLPPMIVTERGESLDEWTQRCNPDFFMCISIVGHLTDRVRRIHGAGLVHRDLKPGNVMWLPSVNGFTVIDFGSAARAGEEAGISFSLAYAAPEAVAAYAKGETRMLVTGALDVWSLGVIFYEFLTGSRVLACSRDDIIAAAAGQVLFPWEEQETLQRRTHMRRLGFLQELILAMLDRDPVKRITMTEMFTQLKVLMNRETTVS
jgi:hypothetical protein